MILRLHITVFILAILIGSCHSQNTSEDKIRDVRAVFTEDQLGHFPSNKEYKLVKYSYLRPIESVEENSGAYLKITYELTVDEIIALNSSLKAQSIAKVKHTDSCTFFIERGERQESPKRYENCNYLLPVPVFLEEMDKYRVEDYSNLPDDFILYVLETKKGKYLENEQLSESINVPIEWNHGISRGIAISELRRHAIFWIEIW